MKFNSQPRILNDELKKKTIQVNIGCLVKATTRVMWRG
jgi:hypothetical protein